MKLPVPGHQGRVAPGSQRRREGLGGDEARHRRPGAGTDRRGVGADSGDGTRARDTGVPGSSGPGLAPAGRYYSRQVTLHGLCFYNGLCDPWMRRSAGSVRRPATSGTPSVWPKERHCEEADRPGRGGSADGPGADRICRVGRSRRNHHRGGSRRFLRRSPAGVVARVRPHSARIPTFRRITEPPSVCVLLAVELPRLT